MTYKLLIDSTADLPPEYVTAHGLIELGMTVTIDGTAHETIGPDRLSSTVLLAQMAKGAQATTAAISSGVFHETFSRLIADGSEVLYLAFSSGLSGTYQSACIARDMVIESHPEAKITVLDTLAAASGEGYLVEEAVKLRESGNNLTETVAALTDLIPRLRSWFMVSDLYHLARGGRIPKATAVLGSIASIKPVLDVDTKGALRQVSKVRGLKKALNALTTESLNDFDQAHQRIIIGHSDAEKDATHIKEQLLAALPVAHISIRPLGPVISVHTGAGTLAVFTFGKHPHD